MLCNGNKEIFDANENMIKINVELEKSSSDEMGDYIWDMRSGLTYEKPDKNTAYTPILGDCRQLTKSDLSSTTIKKNYEVVDVFACSVCPDFYCTGEEYPALSGGRIELFSPVSIAPCLS